MKCSVLSKLWCGARLDSGSMADCVSESTQTANELQWLKSKVLGRCNAARRVRCSRLDDFIQSEFCRSVEFGFARSVYFCNLLFSALANAEDCAFWFVRSLRIGKKNASSKRETKWLHIERVPIVLHLLIRTVDSTIYIIVLLAFSHKSPVNFSWHTRPQGSKWS